MLDFARQANEWAAGSTPFDLWERRLRMEQPSQCGRLPQHGLPNALI